MSLSASQHLLYLFKRNKTAILFFGISVALCSLLSFVDLTLCALAVSLVALAALILIFKLMITECKTYYQMLKSDCGFMPQKLFTNSVFLVSLVLTLAAALMFGCYGLTVRCALNADLSAYEITSEYEAELSEEEITRLEETMDAIGTLTDKVLSMGYTSPPLYISLFLSFVISIISTVVEWHVAMSFAAKLKFNPVLTAIITLLLISFINEFIISIIMTLISFSAPGITSAISEINSFATISGSEKTTVEFIYDMTNRLPHAETLVKIVIISGMLTLVTTFTNALAALTFLRKKNNSQ